MADRNSPPEGWPPADDPYAYGAPPPQYAEGTYDQLNFRNPGRPADQPPPATYGQPQHGQPQHGQPQHGQPPYEQAQYEQAQYEQAQYEQAQYEQPQYDRHPYRQPAPPPRREDEQPPHHVGAAIAADEYVHSHVHSATNPMSERTRKAVVGILVPAVIATIIGLIVLWPGQLHYGSANQNGQQERADGTVTQVVEQSCPETSEADAGSLTGPCGTATVKVTGGVGKGDTVSMELPQGPGSPSVHVDDKVVMLVLATGGNAATRYTIVDKQRGGSLWLLVALSAAVVIAFGRLRGLAAIGGLIVSFAVLLLFVIPGILGGSPPLLVAVVGSSAIMFAVLYLTHGISVRTSVAILGTLASLVLTGLLGAGFTALTELTGLGDESSVYLSTVQGGVDMRGLLLAGIIIGSLGVLDDVTVTQAEVVAELARTPRSRFDLYRAAIRVGRAHVGSAVNTIVLAYAGASLPLLLLISVSGQSLGSLVTGQSIASEIVRSLVGTIGLVASVPITTALAALVAEPPAEDDEEQAQHTGV
ncbi:YibE/F family protein [Cryptosporangium sp. NPDC051539]|uniref:YibE/F family protein n=1 Tax=Cryptosporangium sp. NPDC051539 TaxID=3363962 RepID=UPI0037B28404